MECRRHQQRIEGNRERRFRRRDDGTGGDQIVKCTFPGRTEVPLIKLAPLNSNVVENSIFLYIDSNFRNDPMFGSRIVPIVSVRVFVTGLNIERTACCDLTTSRTDLGLSIQVEMRNHCRATVSAIGLRIPGSRVVAPLVERSYFCSIDVILNRT